MNSLSELGRAVAKLRREHGMTQKELASAVGMGQSTLARFETGGVGEFGSHKLLRLLEVLGYTLSYEQVNRSFALDDALLEKQRTFSEDKDASS